MFFVSSTASVNTEVRSYEDNQLVKMGDELREFYGSPTVTYFTTDELDNMLRGAVEAALFTASIFEPGDDEPGEGNGPTGGDARKFRDEFSDDIRESIRDDFESWVQSSPVGVREALDHLGRTSTFSESAADRLGTLWLFSAQGQGAGLWDGDLPDDLGRTLHSYAGYVSSVEIDARDEDAPALIIF